MRELTDATAACKIISVEADTSATGRDYNRCHSKLRMRFDVTIASDSDGFVAECESLACHATGLSATNALDALRDEIRYRLELCPCTTVNDDFVELNVVSAL